MALLLSAIAVSLVACTSSSGEDGTSGGGGSTADTMRPTVAIVNPTAASTYTALATPLDLSGSASDNLGVTQVTWSNSMGGSGTATGTGSWSVNGIALQTGTNIITVSARDAAGNIGTSTLQVSYNTVPVAGTTYYVATNGADTNNGTSLNTPFRTLNKAINTVGPGDTIEIRAGTYVESKLIDTPGSPTGWITMRAYQNEQVIVSSTGSGPTFYFYHSLCDESVILNGSGNTDCQPLYWIVQGLEIRGSPNGGGDGNAIKIDTPKVKLIGNRICCAKADVVKLVRTANGVEVLNNEIWQNPAIVTPSGNAQGVDIVGADDVRVANNYLHDIDDIGIYAKGNSRRAVFESNRLENMALSSGANALMLGQSTDAIRVVDGNYESYDGIIRNNIVRNTGGPCLATASSFNVRIYNNSCYNTGQVMHGSILISNESELAQSGTNIEIKNNIIYGSASRPVIKISNFMGPALTDNTTLFIDKNIYFITGGAPKFTWDSQFTNVDVAPWRTNYTSLTGHSDTSLAVDPQYASTTDLTLNPTSPAIDAGLNTPLVITDFTGAARPAGATTDIGAYEYPGTSFSFMAYGDSRAGVDCSANAVHIGLVNRMVGEAADFVFHLGDMITGYNSNTNWVENGPCTGPTSFGSFKNMIAPLQNKTPAAGLPTFYFPVVGNHDDNWGSGWYPDPFGHGFCDVFNPTPLVPNHTQQPYFLDPSATRYSDIQFYSLACSKTVTMSDVYSRYLYYSFNHKNAHFAVLRLNDDYHDLEVCNNCASTDQSNYDNYYNIHQLDWLRADLAAAGANPAIEHIFVFLHAPLFTSSYGHDANVSWPTLSKEVSSHSGKVKVVFSGHNHVYERSKAVFASTSFPTGTEDNINGTVYVVTGGGGSDPHGFNALPWFIATRTVEYHYMKIDVTGSTFSVKAIKADGTVIDSFTR